MMSQTQISLKSLIAPQFYEVHNDIKKGLHTHYKLWGGRGSTKSSFTGIEIPFGMMKDPEANAVCLRRVGNTLRDSVYEQILWGIEALGVSHLWKKNVSTMTLTYIPTGQKIVFRGCDDPNKIKSIKVKCGYFKYIWFEERAEFDGEAEERKVLQSLMRGGEKYVVFYTWNPPKSIDNWVNQDILDEDDDTFYSHSTYLTVPKKWLGEQFLAEANKLKKKNFTAYRHEYLGEATGTGGQVFDNVVAREITDEEIAQFDRVKQGLDFGFAADPLAYVRANYDKKHGRLFVFDEIYQVNLKTSTLVREIRKKNPENGYVKADSEEPRSISTLNENGLRVLPVKKGPGSVEFGIQYLANEIDEIIIDPKRCPNTLREFKSYELEQDKNGNFKGSYPDKDNHSIDAVRYALNDEIMNKKARVKNKKKAGF